MMPFTRIGVCLMLYLCKVYYVIREAVSIQPSKDNTTTMSTKGQLTIPSCIRDRLALRPGIGSRARLQTVQPS